MKKSVVLIVAGVLVVVGILVVVARQRPETVIIDESTTDEMVLDDAQEETFSGSLMEAIAQGVPMKCSYEANGVYYEGFVKGENYRGKVSQDDQTMEVIVTDGYSYIWQEGKTQGMKMAFDAEAVEETNDEDVSAFARPDIEYRCSPAVVTDSKFSLPEDVSFLDLDQMMNQGQLSEEQIDQLEEMSEE